MNGAQISAPLAPYGSQTTGAGSLTDRNGNIISVGSGSTPTFTDTLGDAALTVSGSGTPPSPTVLSYTNPSGGSSSYKVTYTAYTVQTAFGCSGTAEYGASPQNLISSITQPDGTSYTFTYETTPGHAPNVTGRLASVILPAGGAISYEYIGGSNGITCADGSAATLKRFTPDSASPWVYTHSESGCASGCTWCTTLTDPSNDQTLFSLTPWSPSGGQTNAYEEQREVYQGSSTLLQTVNTCYNGATPPCPTAVITSFPPGQVTTSTIPGGYTLQAWQTTTYNTYGLPLTFDEYSYGNGAQGGLVRSTVTAYASLGNEIVDMPKSVSVYNLNGGLVVQTNYTYDQGTVTATSGTPQHASISGSRGNATTVQYLTGGSTYLTQTYTYYDTGNVNVFTDTNGGQTTYAYGSGTSCGNSFPTGVTEAVTTLTLSYAWTCSGGVAASMIDENGEMWSAGYTDLNYWRPTSTTDPTAATTALSYYTGPFAAESTLNFGTNSTADTRSILDGLGRTHVTQQRQGQGSAYYDSVETDYDAEGRPNQVTVPYTETAGQTNSSAPRTTTTYDALGRPTQVVDNSGDTITYSYTQTPGTQVGFDVLVTVGASSGQTFQRQLEYNSVGWLTSVCEITSAAGSGPCAQSVAATGFRTAYAYSLLNEVTNVEQNAQSSSNQTRAYSYDGLGRLLAEYNPETRQVGYIYTYDTDATCGSSGGDLVKRTDPVGNVTCLAYDGLHRLTAVTYPSGSYASVTPPKTYVYDSAVVDGLSMSYTKSRLAEAYTGPSTSKITDVGLSYTSRGQVAADFESTPNSGGYYKFVNSYWPNGSVYTRWIAGTPAWYYNPDGEGRVSTVTASAYQNPVTSTLYNGFSEPTVVTYGSGNSDSFGYDPNTGRMTSYTYTVAGKTVNGALTWNTNGTLKSLAVTDQWTPANNQTCSYGYDSLSRLNSVGCGSAWSQSFSYDAFGNITKSGSQSFQPTYSYLTNQYTAIGPVTPAYDANGNLTYDGFHSYTWDAEGKLHGLDGAASFTYDALGRRAEQITNGTAVQSICDPLGIKVVLATPGRTLADARLPLVGGAIAQYVDTVLSRYWHADWPRGWSPPPPKRLRWMPRSPLMASNTCRPRRSTTSGPARRSRTRRPIFGTSLTASIIRFRGASSFPTRPGWPLWTRRIRRVGTGRVCERRSDGGHRPVRAYGPRPAARLVVPTVADFLQYDEFPGHLWGWHVDRRPLFAAVRHHGLRAGRRR